MPAEFKREELYIVIKRKDLNTAPFAALHSFLEHLQALDGLLPARQFLVIESDWPEYEPAWAMIEARMTGQPPTPVRKLKCWSCQEAFSLKDRQANDGCCGKCGAEIELDDYLAAILAENEQLRGIQPDWPPRPPDGDGLPRYGLRWNGPQQPLSTPMEDGYWTPWHLAKNIQEQLVEIVDAKPFGPVEVRRDKDGWWYHPGVPDFDGGEDPAPYIAWVAEQGLELKGWHSGDELGELPEEDAACTAWNPESPGPEWFLMGIFDTDDGPYVQWARRVVTP
jgi:hypothetical protein